MPTSIEPLATALAAVRAAGDYLRANFGRPQEVQYKGEVNLVTEADRAAEAMIAGMIRRAHPDHDLLAEEGEAMRRGATHLWLIDPLDGTTNYAHGYPFFAVSVALQREGETVLGVVYDPLREELFVAERGKGARLGGHPLRVSSVNDLGRAFLVTGFPYDIRTEPEAVMARFGAFAVSAQGVRRDGSAALDLCYVAAGRFDGFWESKLHPWDVAAGSLIVTEGGGRLSDFSGGPLDVFGQEIVASNGSIHDQMLDVLRKAIPPLT